MPSQPRLDLGAGFSFRPAHYLRRGHLPSRCLVPRPVPRQSPHVPFPCEQGERAPASHRNGRRGASVAARAGAIADAGPGALPGIGNQFMFHLRCGPSSGQYNGREHELREVCVEGGIYELGSGRASNHLPSFSSHRARYFMCNLRFGTYFRRRWRNVLRHGSALCGVDRDRGRGR